MTYGLEQYVEDLRAITAQETDPVKITELVAPPPSSRGLT